MSNELGMAFGDAIGGAMASFRNDRARQDLLNKEQAQREHERRVEEVRRAIAQIESGSRERVAGTNAASRGYAADLGYAGRQYAADASTAAADTRADATRYGADVSGRTRLGAARIGAGAREASDANAVKIAKLRNAGNLATTGLRNRGTLAAATARARNPTGTSPDVIAQRDRASARSLYGRLFGPRAPQYDSVGNPVPQAPRPDFNEWMKSQGVAPSTAQPGATAQPTYAPQHQQTASQMLQQIRAAEASGDVEKVKALKAQAAKFLSTLQPGAGAAPPPQPDDQFDDGTDDGTDDGLDDGLDEEDDDDEDDGSQP